MNRSRLAFAGAGLLLVLAAGPAPGADPWPMFRHDANHTGFSPSHVPPNTNSVAWTYRLARSGTANGVYGSPAVANGRIYSTSGDGWLTCLDLDGKLLWTNLTYNYHGMSSSPFVANGKVFVGCDSLPRFFAFDAGTGTQVWRYVDATGVMLGIYSSPVVAGGRVYVGSGSNSIVCLPEDDPNGDGTISAGEVIWRKPMPDQVWSSPTVVDGRLYIGCGDANTTGTNRFYCLDAGTGTNIWVYPPAGDIVDVLGTPVVAGGKVYFGAVDGSAYCLSANNGAMVWNTVLGMPIWSSPALAYGRVFIGCNDNSLYCLDANSGTQIWSFASGGQVWSSPTVADGKVYFGSCDGFVYCLDATADAAREIWRLQIDPTSSANGVPGSPTIYEGYLLVGGWDATSPLLFCIGSTDSDGDGLPNAWETAFGLNPNGSSGNDGPDGDPDGDGMSNLDEYIADTNPTNGASLLTLIGIGDPGSGVRVGWRGGTQVRQVVERTAQLPGGPVAWTPVRTNEPPTPLTNWVTDAGEPADRSFYRIRVRR